MRHSLACGFLLLGLLSACASPAATVAPVPADVPATVTSIPPAPPTTSMPAPVMSGLAMFENGGWGWNADTGQLYRTMDDGQTWSPVDLSGSEGYVFSTDAFLDTETAWISASGMQDTAPRLLHTADGGATWTEILPQGLDSLAGAFDYHFISTTDGWAEAADAGAGNMYLRVFETHDGGESYQVVPILASESDQGLPAGTVHLCNICDDSFYYDPARILIVTGDLGSMESRGAVHARLSVDDGKTWTEVALPLPEDYPDALVAPLLPTFPTDSDGFLPVILTQYHSDGSSPYRVLAIYASHDAGRTWELAPGLVESVSSFPHLQFLNESDAILECGSAICITHDGAHTWHSFPLDPSLAPDDSRSIIQLDLVDALTAWMVIGTYSNDSMTYSLYKTTDGAATWLLQ